MVKGYLLGQITISDKSQYKKYDAKIGDVIKEFGGKYLVKGGLRMVKEGNPSFSKRRISRVQRYQNCSAFFLIAAI